jgi:hypothetical protein
MCNQGYVMIMLCVSAITCMVKMVTIERHGMHSQTALGSLAAMPYAACRVKANRIIHANRLAP